jgi:serine-type D-Ala-D-Ala carboxypeptidase/endopeptidase (penicillin-binding protein 4)
MTATARRSATLAAALIVLVTAITACTAEAPATPTNDAPVPSDVLAIMHGPNYPHARWGLAVQDLETGERLVDLNADEFFPPGSTTKVFTVLPTLDALGDDHRFVTPVYATAAPAGGVVSGDVVLVAQGDVFFGARRVSDDELSFTDFDHMEANSFPGLAGLVPEDPLAGIASLADQIADAGVTAITGEVIIDDRLFPRGQQLSGIPLDPMYINENVIDITLTATSDGDAAGLDWRPRISTLDVVSDVTTGGADTRPQISISTLADGTISVSGSVPEGGVPVVQVAEIDDPSTFARTALIDALRERGIRVSADPAEENPARLLPDGDYADLRKLAEYESAPFSEYAKVIWKVSHNRGADNDMCLLAVRGGEQNCEAGIGVAGDFLTSIGVDGTGISFGDGRGGVPSDLTTPDAAIELLTAMSERSDFEELKNALPILGVDGSIANDDTGTGATGHVYAKTGTVAGGDLTTGQLTVIAETLIGYIDAKSGRELVFALYVNNLKLPDINDLFDVFGDENEIAGLLYERY